ncbi:MAG: hypothetical protein G01um101418_203 [Parcubacteria group bacterium Gr01-1014_18]|nr:MAG: hypothetical protein Greene041636_171 [Parcubacteria group bacterium Greene0416_36]TSC81363.1 MAG: hypothetical protein G01um101418_203 [Parcubacteria group bacterium Gr01-1014_18]TSC99451.1 MAG: hypothetical protein Greene101420_118 [Parcubacteria group bacterium Greene1014_20]TSD07630.1 MAG: hypothetical protein Greene07142_87 [Parcubacteria group bacterium Greene0714_2]
MPLYLIEEPISIERLKEIASERFGDMVKVVVDIEKGAMVVGGELHADEESDLIGRGSMQENLWGINLYPDITGENWLEFDSMINVRPRQNNRTRGVEDPDIREKINRLVDQLVKRS